MTTKKNMLLGKVLFLFTVCLFVKLIYCEICATGYFWNGTSCQVCSWSCEICTSDTRCKSCSPGFYLSGSFCVKCPSGCSSCKSTDNCSGCANGYYLENNLCHRCIAQCRSCNAFMDCNECKEGYYLSNGYCNACSASCSACSGRYKCSKCRNGYYLSYNQYCYQCSSNCLSCTSAGNCFSCAGGYVWQDNICKQCRTNCISCSLMNYCITCRQGYYTKTIGFLNNICELCPPNCVSCTSLSYCYVCEAGFFGPDCSAECSNCKNRTQCNKYTGHCFNGCRDGLAGSFCNRACNVDCKSCSRKDINKCFDCVENRYGKTGYDYTCENSCSDKCVSHACDDDTGHCLTGCISGYWGRTCSSVCSDNCIEGKCNAEKGYCSLGCIKGYKGVICNCPQNCNCNGDGSCESCMEGFAVTKQKCECATCLDPPCSSCPNSSYYILDNSCCPCGKHCKNNECNSDGVCIDGCKIGYYANDCSKRCKINDPHCLECLTDTSNAYGGCSRCIKDFFPSIANRSCHACSATCQNGTCDSRTGVCSTGCRDGWWGQTCEKSCDPDCVFCSQADGQCSVCSDSKYLYDCSLTCSANCNTVDEISMCRITDGYCIKGCVNRTYYGTRCEKKCKSTCKNNVCDRETGTCIDGCENNFFGPQCEYKCKDTCLILNDGKLCYESNGTCISNCHNGYHGFMCHMNCSQNCINRTCDRLTGACEYGCDSGFEGQQCEFALTGTEANGTTAIALVVGAVSLVFVIIGIITIVFLVKRLNKKATNKSNGTDENRYENTAVTFSDVRESEVEATGNNAVYARPIKPRKREVKEPMTLNNTNSDVSTITERMNTNTDNERINLHDDICKHQEDKTIRSKEHCTPPLAQTPKDPNKSTYFRQSTLTNSGTQHRSRKSTRSVLEIEEDLGSMDQADEHSMTKKDAEGEYTYYNVADMKKRKVPLEKLAGYVLKMTKEDFDEEFNKLPPGLIKPYTESQKKENKTKNRYKGIYPYDQTRVILTGGQSDYINASFMDGFKKRKKYIASIGPTYKYMGDMSSFWKMVWQQDVGKIVMLTKLSEAGETKCDRYWPETDGFVLFADIRVSADREDIYADYTIRYFTVQKNSEVRHIVQAHFTAWPDKGIPDDVTCLIEFREKVNSIKTGQNGPILVHCSAGIGRTGTYIAIDSISQEGETDGTVDIYACVSNLREQRVNMVQTAAQYKYLHYAVVHNLMFDSKPIKAAEFHEYMSSHTVAQFERQLQKLQISAQSRTDDELEAVRMNKKMKDKNRSGADIPGDNNRPRLYLRRIQTVSGYINALYINSFRTVNRFLVAQTPLPNTVEDFLALIVQENVSCVVAMGTDLSENITVGSYYPEDKQTLSIGSVTVQTEEEKCMDQYVQRKLKISHQGKFVKEEVKVTHIQYTKWTGKKKTPDNPNMFMQFVKDVETMCDGTRIKGPILVHCLTGAERSGLFCVVSILLEKTLADQEVSVVNTVCQVKNRRHKSIPNKEQYIFCHQCLDEYLHTFDTYSNFCLAK